MTTGIYYDQQRGNRLSLMSIRWDGKALFQDLDDQNSRVICGLSTVGEYPPAPLRKKTVWPLERIFSS